MTLITLIQSQLSVWFLLNDCSLLRFGDILLIPKCICRLGWGKMFF